jgi:hypothetical protein
VDIFFSNAKMLVNVGENYKWKTPLLSVKEVAEKIWTMPPDQQLKVVVWLRSAKR